MMLDESGYKINHIELRLYDGVILELHKVSNRLGAESILLRDASLLVNYGTIIINKNTYITLGFPWEINPNSPPEIMINEGFIHIKGSSNTSSGISLSASEFINKGSIIFEQGTLLIGLKTIEDSESIFINDGEISFDARSELYIERGELINNGLLTNKGKQNVGVHGSLVNN